MVKFRKRPDHHSTAQVERILVLTPDGLALEPPTIQLAIKALEKYKLKPSSKRFERYEIQIRYINEGFVDARITEKEDAIAFLRIFLPTVHPA